MESPFLGSMLPQYIVINELFFPECTFSAKYTFYETFPVGALLFQGVLFVQSDLLVESAKYTLYVNHTLSATCTFSAMCNFSSKFLLVQ